ncbi:MAG: hypothetical protein GWP19_06375 [Planctomycetia bacterium]|nr:hypothetical protein [Planctomycetia bacterium]
MNKKIRDQIANVDLESLKEQFQGAEYSDLVQQQLRKLGSRITQAHAACLAAFTQEEWDVLNEIAKEYVTIKALDINFWKKDCSKVFFEICDQFKKRLKKNNITLDDKIIFNAFQAVTLNFARIANSNKKFRKFTGIKKGIFFT